MGLSSGAGLVVMTLGERSLVNHPILAEDDDDEEDNDEDLTRGSLVTHDLVPPEQLMMQEDLSKNDGDDESGSDAATPFPLKLTNKLPCLLHMPLTIKKELKLAEPSHLTEKDKKAAKIYCCAPRRRKENSAHQQKFSQSMRMDRWVFRALSVMCALTVMLHFELTTICRDTYLFTQERSPFSALSVTCALSKSIFYRGMRRSTLVRSHFDVMNVA